MSDSPTAKPHDGLREVEDPGPEPTGYRAALVLAIILVLVVLGYSLYTHSQPEPPRLQEQTAPQ